MNEEKSLQELEKDYDETIKDLKNMSMKQLKELANKKRDILSNMDYAFAVQNANGNLSEANDIHKKLGKRWLEDFQDPFWDELRIEKARNDFYAEIDCFKEDLKYANDVYDIETSLDNFYDSFDLIKKQWSDKCLWYSLNYEDIFNQRDLIEFIDVLDEYEEFLTSDEI